MPTTVCVINLKGGVGKSTITALLSRHAFNSRGKDVLAIDLDPQANLSQGLLHQEYSNFLAHRRGSIVEVFQDYMPPKKGSGGPQPLTADDVTEIILERNGRRLELIPSRFDFSDALTKLSDLTQKYLQSSWRKILNQKILSLLTVRRPSLCLRLRPITPAITF